MEARNKLNKTNWKDEIKVCCIFIIKKIKFHLYTYYFLSCHINNAKYTNYSEILVSTTLKYIQKIAEIENSIFSTVKIHIILTNNSKEKRNSNLCLNMVHIWLRSYHIHWTIYEAHASSTTKLEKKKKKNTPRARISCAFVTSSPSHVPFFANERQNIIHVVSWGWWETGDARKWRPFETAIALLTRRLARARYETLGKYPGAFFLADAGE